VLELPREIRHQSITLFAGRVLEQPTDMLIKFISLRKQSIVLSSSRHGAIETKEKKNARYINTEWPAGETTQMELDKHGA